MTEFILCLRANYDQVMWTVVKNDSLFLVVACVITRVAYSFVYFY